MHASAVRTALAVLCLVCLATAETTVAEAERPPRSVDDTLLGKRLRLGAKRGDLALQNRFATLVVRAGDGELVDFFRHDDPVATAPQLQGLRGMDGIWQLGPLLRQGITPYPVKATRVRALLEGVETEADVILERGSVRVTTAYRLDPSRARVIITSVVLNTGTKDLRHLHFGDSVKWGNVEYFVEGVGRTPPTFRGLGRWIGRKGAGGDLKLVTLEDEPMALAYRPTSTGFAPPIRATYRTLELEPGQWEVVQRSLVYEAIAEPPPRERPHGTLRARILDERGRPLPSKLTFSGRYGTPDPSFGNDGGLDGAGRFVWSGSGHFERALPTGKYRVLATAGPERDAGSFLVEMRPNQTVTIEGRLPRVISTPGVISADLHLHQAPSVDADIAFDARIVAIAAEGIELAAATDHYVVTDLGPTVRKLMQEGRLSAPLRTLVGTEVSTVGRRFGHFNVFPLEPDARVPYEDTTPHELMTALRALSPDGVIQVNHPRWPNIGYFDYLDMDPSNGLVPEARRAEYATDFDALEVFNGLDAWSPALVRQVIKDWLHQLDHGHRFTATGNSDSHKLFFEDPGLPRNMIRYGAAASDDHDVHAPEQAILDALRGGRVVVTSGPMLDVDIEGKGPGETVASTGQPLALTIRVRAAPWIDVSNVTVLAGKKPREVRHFDVPPSKSVVRLERTVLVPGDVSSYYVVLVTGNRPLPNVHLPNIKPFAFSNPIWVAAKPRPEAPPAPGGG